MVSNQLLKLVEKKYFGNLRKLPKEVIDLRQDFYALELQLLEIFKLLNSPYQKSEYFLNKQYVAILELLHTSESKLTKLS